MWKNSKHVILLIFVAVFLLGTSENTYARDHVEKQKEYRGQDLSLILPWGYEEIQTPYMDIAPSFSNEQTVVRVFVQELGSKLSYQSYVNYGNEQLRKGVGGFKITHKEEGLINNYRYNSYEYTRPLMKSRQNDMNYYKEIHLYDIDNQRAITLWAKTADRYQWLMKDDLESIVQTLRSQNIGIQSKDKRKTFKEQDPHINYQGLNSELNIPSGKTMWGRFFPGVPFESPNYDIMLESERILEHKFDFIMSYTVFPSARPFPEQDIKRVYRDGRTFMLTLQPFDPSQPDLSWVAIMEILEGKHDEVMREWARGLKRIEEPIFIRPLNEMNGDWDPWCTWFFGKDNDLYIEAWQHMYNIFKEEGGDQLYFVWNPHDRSYPDFTWNNPHLYYPGDEYVEWVGLTGYNNGTSHKGDVWRGFNEIYDPLYEDYMIRYGDKPFMITEFSTNEVGGSKVAWLEECMNSLNQNRYPNIKIAVWFDGQDRLWQYQINSTPEAQDSFRQGLKKDNFI